MIVRRWQPIFPTGLKWRMDWKERIKLVLVPEGMGGKKIEDVMLVSVNSSLGGKLSLPGARSGSL